VFADTRENLKFHFVLLVGGKMLSNGQLKDAVEKLRARQSVIPDEDVKSLFQRAVDCEYWRTLCPEMEVMSRRRLDHRAGEPLSSEQVIWACGHLERHGYFQIPEIIPLAVIDRMYKCVETLRSSGWAPTFSFVYDEFWSILRTPSLVELLSRKLGTGYLQTAPVWTYRVDPHARGSGWSPHVDSRNDEERITVWIPLTDASVGNGCMYVIPQDRVPPGLPASYLDWTAVSRDELGILLRNIILLPATVGSVLGWNNSLIHWGGRALEPTAPPRISIGVEFMSKGARPRSWEVPTFDLQLPDLATRLRVIGQSIFHYETFEPMMRKYCGLAAKLIE
jgi:Phytanoyl-CoA dioxygenase (PhyH)